LNLEVQITPFFKNKHFELCCFVTYRVRNIVNRRESDVIRHSVRRSWVSTSGSINRSCKVFELSWRNMQRMGDLDHNEKCNSIVKHYCSKSEKLSRLNVFIQSMDVYINHIWGFLQVSRFCSQMCMLLSWSSTKVSMVCTQTLEHWKFCPYRPQQ
jgi:hypothetical protein